MKMGNLIKLKGLLSKIFLLFFIAILFSQVFLHQVVADEIKDGTFEINSGDWINIQCGTNTTILWQFQVDTNERAIYWEIMGYNDFFKTGWGPNASFTTPILNETDARYEYVCHGYYAKSHVWSTMVVTCTETGQINGNNGVDPMIFIYIGIPIILVSGIALVVVVYLRRKKKQDFF